MTKGERTFNANVEALFEEISSAVTWKRPCIIVVISNDFWVRSRAMQALEKRLTTEGGIDVNIFNFALYNHGDVVEALKSLPQGNKVYFVMNLIASTSTGEDTFSYRALNMRRETFVEDNLKVVIWLSEREASLLPVHAPDFWAFRHRVIIFFDSRRIKNPYMAGSLFLWHTDREEIGLEELKKGVEDSLLDLEHMPDDSAMDERIRILGDLTRYFWMLGEQNRSQEYSDKGLSLGERFSRNYGLINLWIGRAAGLFYKGRFSEAQTILENINDVFGETPAGLMNLAIVLAFVSPKKAGITMARRTAERFNENPHVFARLAYLLYLSGSLDEADKWFKLAAEHQEGHKYKIGQVICGIKLQNAVRQNLKWEREDLIQKACMALATHDDAAALELLDMEIHLQRENYGTLLMNNPNLWIAAYPRNLESLLRRLPL